MKINLKSNLTWIIIFALLCAVCTAVTLFRSGFGEETGVAVIRLDGDIIREINLAECDEPLEFTVEDKRGGHNTIRVQDGRIAVVDADCPDKICVKRGYIDSGAAPVICLPHRLTVTVINGNDSVDAVAGAN